MTEKISDCPFCGKSETKVTSFITDANDRHAEYTILCLNCGAYGPSDLSTKRAYEMWNLRRPMKSAEAFAAELEAERGAALEQARTTLKKIEDQASRAVLVQDRSVGIIKQTCKIISDEAKEALS